MLKRIKVFIFGERVRGEVLPPKPRVRSIYPVQRISEFDWYKEVGACRLVPRGGGGH